MNPTPCVHGMEPMVVWSIMLAVMLNQDVQDEQNTCMPVARLIFWIASIFLLVSIVSVVSINGPPPVTGLPSCPGGSLKRPYLRRTRLLARSFTPQP